LEFEKQLEAILAGTPGMPRFDVMGRSQFGNLQIERWLPECLILCQDNLLRDIAVPGFQTEAFAGLRIYTIELISAFAAVYQTEPIFHRHVMQPTREVNRVVKVLRPCWRVLTRLGVRRESSARFGARCGTLPW
jgi:hypothetical protein